MVVFENRYTLPVATSIIYSSLYRRNYSPLPAGTLLYAIISTEEVFQVSEKRDESGSKTKQSCCQYGLFALDLRHIHLSARSARTGEENGPGRVPFHGSACVLISKFLAVRIEELLHPLLRNVFLNRQYF